jgi:hypothetical protein
MKALRAMGGRTRIAGMAALSLVAVQLAVVTAASPAAAAGEPVIDPTLKPSAPTTRQISEVDASRRHYDRIALKVDGKPFFFNGVQMPAQERRWSNMLSVDRSPRYLPRKEDLAGSIESHQRLVDALTSTTGKRSDRVGGTPQGPHPASELLTESVGVAVRDDAGGDCEEGFVDVVAAFPADAQAFHAVAPGDGAFRDPAVHAQV